MLGRSAAEGADVSYSYHLPDDLRLWLLRRPHLGRSAVLWNPENCRSSGAHFVAVKGGIRTFAIVSYASGGSDWR